MAAATSTPAPIRFTDGAGYERYMGVWSQLAGEAFLAHLAPAPGLRWLDVGCGNGAFTELIAKSCAPVALAGIDPSEEQLAFARARPATRSADYVTGDAMALPYGAATFDVAVMPLVLFFVPSPAVGVAEMARVVRPGGTVSAYSWDLPGGGFPYAALQGALRGMGFTVPMPPSPDAVRMTMLTELWAGAGLEAVETWEITVQRTYSDFAEFWTVAQGGASMRPIFATMSADDMASLQGRMRELLPADNEGRITYSARANAVQGRVPTPQQ